MVEQAKEGLVNIWLSLTGGRYVPLYFFMHIPKTAGTSFRHMLVNKFADEHILPNQNDQTTPQYRYVDIEAFLKEYPERKKNTRLVVGHAAYGTETFFNRKRVFRMTFLRDPIDRTISTLKQHHRRYPELIDWPLEDIMEKYEERFRDRQTTLFTRDQEALSDEDRLALAVDRMNEFEFIGITEQFPESIQLLEHQTGWSFPKVIRKNTSKRPLDISPTVMEKMKSWNQMDQQLYEAGVKRFQDQFQSITNTLP